MLDQMCDKHDFVVWMIKKQITGTICNGCCHCTPRIRSVSSRCLFFPFFPSLSLSFFLFLFFLYLFSFSFSSLFFSAGPTYRLILHVLPYHYTSHLCNQSPQKILHDSTVFCCMCLRMEVVLFLSFLFFV